MMKRWIFMGFLLLGGAPAEAGKHINIRQVEVQLPYNLQGHYPLRSVRLATAARAEEGVMDESGQSALAMNLDATAAHELSVELTSYSHAGIDLKRTMSNPFIEESSGRESPQRLVLQIFGNVDPINQTPERLHANARTLATAAETVQWHFQSLSALDLSPMAAPVKKQMPVLGGRRSRPKKLMFDPLPPPMLSDDELSSDPS